MKLSTPNFLLSALGKLIMDVIVTAVLWTYFIAGYLLFFAPRHVFAGFFAKEREAAFQRINHRFCRTFIRLMTALCPGLAIRIHPGIENLHGRVVVANHLSYLDPLFMIALFPRHKTFVKGSLFALPVFGRMLEWSGYLPAGGSDRAVGKVLQGMANMAAFIQDGGVLFIFPEGTRSRDGRVGTFGKGAFRIARQCRSPVAVLGICNTGRLFPPDRILFNTCKASTIVIEPVADITADTLLADVSPLRLAARSREVLDRWLMQRE